MLRVSVVLKEEESKALKAIMEHVATTSHAQGIRFALINTFKKILPQNTNILVKKEADNG